MAHIRRQIRDAILSELGILADEGYFLTHQPPTSLSTNQLPAVVVSMGRNESSEVVTMGQSVTLERVPELRISAIFKDEEQEFLDDKMEYIAEQIELLITQRHGGLAKSTLLISTEKESASVDDTPVAAITLEYAVVYHTAANQPNIAM